MIFTRQELDYWCLPKTYIPIQTLLAHKYEVLIFYESFNLLFSQQFMIVFDLSASPQRRVFYL